MGVTECRTRAKDAVNHIGLKCTFSLLNTSLFGFVYYWSAFLFLAILMWKKTRIQVKEEPGED